MCSNLVCIHIRRMVGRSIGRYTYTTEAPYLLRCESTEVNILPRSYVDRGFRLTYHSVGAQQTKVVPENGSLKDTIFPRKLISNI